MRISAEEVKKVAKLANLPVSEEEEKKYSEQLTKILDYIDELKKLKTTDIEPVFNVSSEKNVTQEDQPLESLTQDEALSNAPNKSKGYFVTKGIFTDE